MFLRLTLLGLGLISSYIGSISFQTGSPSDMIAGGIALLIGILSFFFLGRGLWRILGCMTTFIIMALVVGGVVFVLTRSDLIWAAKNKLADTVGDVAEKTGLNTNENTQSSQEGQPQPAGAPQQQAVQQPQQQSLPPLVGHIEKIISGDLFRIGQYTVRLYGIASPILGQTCHDAKGHSYECGYISARMLKDFVNGDEVTCKVMNINAKRELMAACSVGTFDIGAAMVQAGWALALPAVTPIYMPYQEQAHKNKAGLWAGTFQLPWEWQTEQNQMREQASQIEVPNLPAPTKKKKKSMFDVF